MSWKTYKLGEILDRKREKALLSEDEHYKLVTIRLKHQGVTLREEKKGTDIKSNMYRVNEGDFILSGIDARNGAFGIVPKELDDAIVTNDFWCLEPKKDLLRKDFFLFLTSTSFFDYICNQCSDGTTQRIRLQKEKFYDFEITLPPIEEQGSLVLALKKSKKLYERLSFELTHQLDLVKQLRQAFLREAMQGKLVPQDPNDLPANPQNKFFVYVFECSDGSWYKGFTIDIIKRWKEHIRGKGAEHTKKYPPVKLIHWEEYETEKEAVNREKFLKSGHGRYWLKQKEKLGQLRQAGEPASVLLEKIKMEKERLIREKKLKKGKASSQSVSKANEWEIPNSWVPIKVGDIFFVTKLAGFEYTKYINFKTIGEIPVVRAQNVRPFELDKTNLLFIDKETSLLLGRCALTKESLLVTFIGAGIGDVARFREKERWHLAPNVSKLEPFEECEDFYNLKFLNYFLSSPYGRNEIFKHVKATAQPSLSMGTIRDIDVPIPPLSEQQRIVDKLDELMGYCDQLEASIKESQGQNELLLQQVLREALEPKVEQV